MVKFIAFLCNFGLDFEQYFENQTGICMFRLVTLLFIIQILETKNHVTQMNPDYGCQVFRCSLYFKFHFPGLTVSK